ncbi:MAG: hypothetical protein NWE87_03180, partial [Candidatus Bathyarchaeota archaeon]|nr:hypothetical protein [Candidatus Bathyarchaeota archaeon]
MKMLFALGFIDPGFTQEIPNSLKKLAGYLIFMPSNGRVNPCSQMIMSSVRMKRPVSRPEFASILLTRPPSEKLMRVEHEYTRGGAWTYLAAWDVHRARIFGRCEEGSGIKPFDRLVDQVMLQAPYKTANRVFWIIDNGSSHRGQPSIE